MVEVKINGDLYHMDEQGNIKLVLNIPYKFNRSHRYNTPREEYIDKNNWKEKLNPNFSIMKVINNVPNADYEFIEYESGDKELVVKTNIKDLNKGNIITGVMVEYEPEIAMDGHTVIGSELKINQDNNINIKPIKESWNRDEVIQFAKKYAKRCQAPIVDTKWIEENL